MKQSGDNERTLKRLSLLAYWLDSRFRIPGTRRTFGLDALIGLIPGVGDTATALLSCYILIEARRLGVPKAALMRMMYNIGVDMLVGFVPFVGDLFDIHWKANERNIGIVNRHMESAHRRDGPRVDRPMDVNQDG